MTRDGGPDRRRCDCRISSSWTCSCSSPESGSDDRPPCLGLPAPDDEKKKLDDTLSGRDDSDGEEDRLLSSEELGLLIAGLDDGEGMDRASTVLVEQ